MIKNKKPETLHYLVMRNGRIKHPEKDTVNPDNVEYIITGYVKCVTSQGYISMREWHIYHPDGTPLDGTRFRWGCASCHFPVKEYLRRHSYYYRVIKTKVFDSKGRSRMVRLPVTGTYKTFYYLMKTLMGLDLYERWDRFNEARWE